MQRKNLALFGLIGLVFLNDARADYGVYPEGHWPKDWPEELESLRAQAVSMEGPMILFRHHLIPFTDREQFEKAWPHILKVKTKGSPIILVPGPKTDFFKLEPAGVYIHCPPARTNAKEAPTKSDVPRERWMWTTYIVLAVDGKIVDLNRIKLPPDTPIIDERFPEKNQLSE